jgi:hypothetical protein
VGVGLSVVGGWGVLVTVDVAVAVSVATAVSVAVAVSVRVRVGVGVGLGVCSRVRLAEGATDGDLLGPAVSELTALLPWLATEDSAPLMSSLLGGVPSPQALRVSGATHSRAAIRSRRIRQILGRYTSREWPPTADALDRCRQGWGSRTLVP